MSHELFYWNSVFGDIDLKKFNFMQCYSIQSHIGTKQCPKNTFLDLGNCKTCESDENLVYNFFAEYNTSILSDNGNKTNKCNIKFYDTKL